MKDSQAEVSVTRITGTGEDALMVNNVEIQQGYPKEDDICVANCMSTPNSKSPANPPMRNLQVSTPDHPATSGPGSAVLPSYPVGRGISLPFSQLLPKSDAGTCTSCNALIAWRRPDNPKKSGVICLDHGLKEGSTTQALNLLTYKNRYSFISPRLPFERSSCLGLGV